MSRGEQHGSMELDPWFEALSWRATLRDAKDEDLAGAVGREWQAWYADAENCRAFDAAIQVHADRDLYRKRARPGKAELDADEYDLSVPIAEWRKTSALSNCRKRRSTIGRGRWFLAGGIAATLAAIAMLVVLPPARLRPESGPGNPVDYATDVGHLKEVHLQDGSSIVLGGQTRLSVAFSGHSRRVRLFEGEAWFKVAHDRHWPFVVSVGASTITDVGTAFVVTRDSDRVFVTVTEGTVAISGPARGPPASGLNQGTVPRPAAFEPIQVTRGEGLSLGTDGALGPVRPTDTHAATAWIHGRLIFYDMPLRYVVEAVDRYSSRHIVVDPSAGALRFGGVVYDDEITDWLNSLETIFPITVKSQGTDLRIEMRH